MSVSPAVACWSAAPLVRCCTSRGAGPQRRDRVRRFRCLPVPSVTQATAWHAGAPGVAPRRRLQQDGCEDPQRPRCVPLRAPRARTRPTDGARCSHPERSLLPGRESEFNNQLGPAAARKRIQMQRGASTTDEAPSLAPPPAPPGRLLSRRRRHAHAARCRRGRALVSASRVPLCPSPHVRARTRRCAPQGRWSVTR